MSQRRGCNWVEHHPTDFGKAVQLIGSNCGLALTTSVPSDDDEAQQRDAEGRSNTQMIGQHTHEQGQYGAATQRHDKVRAGLLGVGTQTAYAYSEDDRVHYRHEQVQRDNSEYGHDFCTSNRDSTQANIDETADD